MSKQAWKEPDTGYGKLGEELPLSDEHEKGSTEKLVREGGMEYGATSRDAAPDPYLQRSLLALLCCCGCGLLALVNALRVKKLFRQGDVEGAQAASRRAMFCSTLAFQVAIFVYVIGGLVAAGGALFGIFYLIDTQHFLLEF